MFKKDWTPEDLMGLTGQTWAACALFAAVQLELFTALDRAGDEGLEEAELARKLDCQERSLGMLLTAMTALGLLERQGDRFKANAFARRYLAADSEDYFGFLLKHSAHILPGWTRLAEAVRSGGRVVELSSVETVDEQRQEAFLMGMFNVARRQADQVAAALDLSGRKTLLDLGGGPGTYAVYFCRHNPGLKATVFDQPGTEKFARAVFARYGLEDRVDFIGGDFLTSPLPGGFDAVWLSQVLHGEAPVPAARLVQRGAEALAEGGLLAVQEFIIDDDRRGPAQPALFSLNMLVQTPGGQAYTQAEISDMMSRAGLTDIQRLPVPLPPGCGIVTGRKGSA